MLLDNLVLIRNHKGEFLDHIIPSVLNNAEPQTPVMSWVRFTIEFVTHRGWQLSHFEGRVPTPGWVQRFTGWPERWCFALSAVTVKPAPCWDRTVQ